MNENKEMLGTAPIGKLLFKLAVSTGNAPCSIIVAIVRKFMLLLPLIYLMPQLTENKTMGVYLAEPVADVIAVTFTAVLFAIQFKRSLKSLNTNPTKEISK